MEQETKKKSWIKVVLEYASEQKARIITAVVFSVVSIISGLIPYYCVYKIIIEFIQDSAEWSKILPWILYGAIAYIVKNILFSISTTLSHIGAFNIIEKLRLRVTECFLHAPLGSVQAHSIGEIKNIIVDKVEKIEPPLAHIIPEGCGHVVLPIVTFIALITIDWRIALSSLVTIPFSFLLMGTTLKLSGKNFAKYNESNVYMNSIIVEYVEGIQVIKAFGRSGTSYEKFSKAITEYRTFVVKWLLSTLTTMKLSFALFPSTLIGTLPVCLVLANNGSITLAQAALGAMLSMSMVTSLGMIEVFVENIRETQYTIEELEKYLEMPLLSEPTELAHIADCKIELKDVGFSYTGDVENEVLHNINLTLPTGSFTALVGPSGGGKSTVAKLIARFWDVTRGSISIGGVDIKNMTLAQLSSVVSMVTQDNYLFRSSIKENIRMGNPNAADEEVYAAARAAQCEEFIAKLPNGYDTLVGESGSRLSGGEKQRVAIARMILKNAPIVILDEATAFTDPENEDKIQRSIAALTKGKTLLVIAHRLSTIKSADNIVVLKNGRIEAQGKQEELLENCALYKNMWNAHIGAKEWAVSSTEKGDALHV